MKKDESSRRDFLKRAAIGGGAAAAAATPLAGERQSVQPALCVVPNTPSTRYIADS